MPGQLLPLEKWLSAQNLSNFPESKNYFTIYSTIKSWLKTNIYPFIGTGAASLDGQFYNDHGESHFDSVIKRAGQLVGVNSDGTNDLRVAPYEVYLLLVSILLHDAGMIAGRNGHEKSPHLILKSMGILAAGDGFETRQIGKIAEAHGGRASDGDKDTIKMLKATESLLDIKFRPKLLAAILRLADEICEDKTRAARFLLDPANQLSIKKENEVFHKYAASINNVSIDPQNNTIRIDYHIAISDLKIKYGKLNEEVYIIDEIYARLRKMNCERIYCNRYMAEVVQIFKIRVSITLNDDDYNDLDSLNFDIEDTGFPDTDLVLPPTSNQWTGETMASRFP